MNFVSYLIYYVLVCLMFLLNCFADATPIHLEYPRGKVWQLPDGVIIVNSLSQHSITDSNKEIVDWPTIQVKEITVRK